MKQRQIQAVKMVARFDAGADSVIRKTRFGDGCFEARWRYFYRHGMSALTCAGRLCEAFGPSLIVITKGDHWATWPKDSYFWVRFKVWGTIAEDAVAKVEKLLAETEETWEKAWKETREYFKGQPGGGREATMR